MGKRDYYPAVRRNGVLLCLSCAEEDVRAGRRPPFDDDPQLEYAPFYTIEGERCAGCGKVIVASGSRLGPEE
jgi:hypothetical protein